MRISDLSRLLDWGSGGRGFHSSVLEHKSAWGQPLFFHQVLLVGEQALQLLCIPTSPLLLPLSFLSLRNRRRGSGGLDVQVPPLAELESGGDLPFMVLQY